MATTDSIELRLVKRLLPFGDGSGFRFTIELLRHAEGESVRIHQHDDYTEILLAHWSEVRDATDRMIQFANGEIQSQSPDAAEAKETDDVAEEMMSAREVKHV